MSQYFLSILLEEVPDLRPEVQAVLLRRKDKLSKRDLPILQRDVHPHVTEWTQRLKVRYAKDGYPEGWATKLREERDQDMIDVIVLDVVGRPAVYGEKPVTSFGRASAVAKVLSWAGLGLVVWSLATHRSPLAIGAVFFAAAMSIVARMLAVQDVWKKYRQ